MHVELMRRGPEQSVCGCPGDADAKQTPDRIWNASSHRWQKGVCSARLARDKWQRHGHSALLRIAAQS